MNNLYYFYIYYAASLISMDVDCNIYVLKNIIDKLKLTEEQIYWVIWLYGNSYNLPTAWIMFDSFPHIEDVTEAKLSSWQDLNLKNIKYQKDCKWNKGHLPHMFQSYKSILNGRSQKEFFNSFDDFESCYQYLVKYLHKFGRFTSWFYLQTLYHICNLPKIKPDKLKLDDSSAKTQKQSLHLILTDGNDYTEHHYKSNKNTYHMLANSIDEDFKNIYTGDLSSDLYALETVLCSFSKLFRESKGRYVGYYIDRQFEDIDKYERSKHFTNIDWYIFHEARRNTFHPVFLESSKIDVIKCKLFYDKREIIWW